MCYYLEQLEQLEKGKEYKLTNLKNKYIKTNEKELADMLNILKVDELIIHLEENTDFVNDLGYLKFKKDGIMVTEFDYEYLLLGKDLTKEEYLEVQKVDVMHKLGLRLNTYYDLFFSKGNKVAYENRVKQCLVQIESDIQLLKRDLEYTLLLFLTRETLEKLLTMEDIKLEKLN